MGLSNSLPTVKTCTLCGHEKELDMFYTDSRGKFGKTARCKKCSCMKSMESRRNNPEAARKADKRYRDKNKDRRSAQNKEWMKNNRLHRISYKKKYRQDNAEYISAYMKDWYKRNPHKYSELSNRRRAREACVDTRRVSNSEWDKIVKRYNCSCFYCGAKQEVTMDHVVPISRGGRHAIGNLIPACMTCNSSKWNKTIMEWRRDNGLKQFTT